MTVARPRMPPVGWKPAPSVEEPADPTANLYKPELDELISLIGYHYVHDRHRIRVAIKRYDKRAVKVEIYRERWKIRYQNWAPRKLGRLQLTEAAGVAKLLLKAVGLEHEP